MLYLSFCWLSVCLFVALDRLFAHDLLTCVLTDVAYCLQSGLKWCMFILNLKNDQALWLTECHNPRTYLSLSVSLSLSLSLCLSVCLSLSLSLYLKIEVCTWTGRAVVCVRLASCKTSLDVDKHWCSSKVPKSRGCACAGVVVLNALLDYESGDLIHSVVVRAIKTTNIDSRTVTATVILQVQDFNDNRPEFTQVKSDIHIFTL